MKCKGCKDCPYYYNCEYCLLEENYVEDMYICPQGEKVDDFEDFESEDFIVVDDEIFSLDNLKVEKKW